MHLIWVALYLSRAALCHVFLRHLESSFDPPEPSRLQDINNAYITPGVYTLNHFGLTMMNVGGTGCSKRDSVIIDMLAMQDRSPDNWQEFLKLSEWLAQNLEISKVLVGPMSVHSLFNFSYTTTCSSAHSKFQKKMNDVRDNVRCKNTKRVFLCLRHYSIIFNMIHPCGQQIKAQKLHVLIKMNGPSIEEHCFQEEQAGVLNDIHLAATSQPIK